MARPEPFWRLCILLRKAGVGSRRRRACYNSALTSHANPALICMATISPFRAWRYAAERVPIRHAVTQPYDKITPAMQEGYYQASPYNLVRIILGRRLQKDGNTDNVYTRARA